MARQHFSMLVGVDVWRTDICETDNKGCTALLLAACYPTMLQWLLEYGGALIMDADNGGMSLWTVPWAYGLPDLLKRAYTKNGSGDIMALTAVLRVMVLHGGPPASRTKKLAPLLRQIVQDGARLRARLPAYLAQRRALLDAHCPLLPPLRDLVHDYEVPNTTDELWATGLGTPLQPAKRSKPERGQSPERRSARLRQKRQ
jgi:hypothetical protein